MVVLSLVVLTVSGGVTLNFGDSGSTLTGSDTPATDSCSALFGATSLGVLYVVVTVVLSLLTLAMPSFCKASGSGQSSVGMMFTGSVA